MDIVQRNLFKLLRSGAFQSKEDIEPMSAFKWGRLYQLAVMHDIIPFVYDGIIRCKGQFFVHLTDKQRPGLFVPASPKDDADVLMLLMPMML